MPANTLTKALFRNKVLIVKRTLHLRGQPFNEARMEDCNAEDSLDGIAAALTGRRESHAELDKPGWLKRLFER